MVGQAEHTLGKNSKSQASRSTGRGGARPLRGVTACRWFFKFLTDPLRCLRDAHKTFGNVAGLGEPIPRRRERLYILALGTDNNRIVFSQPELFRTTGQGVSGRHGSALRRMRYGMTRIQGERHRNQRDLVMPAFQKRAVDSYCPSMVDSTRQVLDGWSMGSTVDIHMELRRITLRLSSNILFRREDPERSVHLGKLMGEYLRKSFSTGVVLFPMNVWGMPMRRLQKHAQTVEREVLAMLAEKRARLASGKHDPSDVIAMLVKAYDDGHEWIRDDDLIGQSVILFAASYETLATSLTWTLFLLEQHPAVLADLKDEIDATLNGNDPTPEHLVRMPLRLAVAKESMRVLPPVPYTIRTVTGDTQLGDYQLKDRDRVVCSHYITHHLPDLYPQPEKFDPRRWETIKPTQYEYLPFSAGPRACIGYRYAMQAIRVILCMVLNRFSPKLMPGTRIDPLVKVTMSSKRGMPMLLRDRREHGDATPVHGRIRELVDLV